MTSRARWAPRLMPAIRRDLTAACDGEVAAAPLVEKLTGHARDEGRRRIEQMRVRSGQLRGSDLYWVTEPMMRLALDASHDMPGVTVQDRPSLHGIMGFTTPLPPLVMDPEMPSLPADVLHWATMPDGRLAVTLLAKPERMPRSWKQVIGDFRYVSPIPGAEVKGMLPFLPDDDESEPGIASLLCLVASIWTMMMTPTVAQRRSLDARTGSASTRQTPRSSDVSIIDLRPLRHVEVDHDEATGRKLAVRHLVRGHWTNQPHGPQRSQRRLQWIAPYIKGPSGAPLKTSEDRVMVWRRA